MTCRHYESCVGCLEEALKIAVEALNSVKLFGHDKAYEVAVDALKKIEEVGK